MANEGGIWIQAQDGGLVNLATFRLIRLNVTTGIKGSASTSIVGYLQNSVQGSAASGPQGQATVREVVLMQSTNTEEMREKYAAMMAALVTNPALRFAEPTPQGIL